MFPLSNWTELDVWRYSEREGVELPSIYYVHESDALLALGAQAVDQLRQVGGAPALRGALDRFIWSASTDFVS